MRDQTVTMYICGLDKFINVNYTLVAPRIENLLSTRFVIEGKAASAPSGINTGSSIICQRKNRQQRLQTCHGTLPKRLRRNGLPHPHGTGRRNPNHRLQHHPPLPRTGGHPAHRRAGT